MSKWEDEFIGQFKEVGTLKKLTKDIKDATNKKKMQEQVEKNLKDVISGKCKRRLR